MKTMMILFIITQENEKKFPKYVEMVMYVSNNAAVFLHCRKQWLV